MSYTVSPTAQKTKAFVTEVLNPKNAETKYEVHPELLSNPKTEHKFSLLEITTIKSWEWSFISEVNGQG